MEHVVLRLLLGGAIEAVYQFAVTRVLTMRSNAAYHIIKTADFLIVTTINSLWMVPGPVRLCISLLFELILPVALSLGSPLQRILRIMLIELNRFITELSGTVIYTTVFGGSVTDVQAIGQENFLSIATVYLILTLISATLFELTVAACNRVDKTNEPFFGMPNILLMLGAFLISGFDYARFLDDPRFQFPNLVCAWLALGSVYLVFLIARRDAASQRESADIALATRKTRHTVTEVRAMSWRAKGLAALRHALASDVREIPRLAGSGLVDQATRQLSDLVEQAHILNGEKR